VLGLNLVRERANMHPILFCPFCGEAFEGEARCPAHELELVPWSALPKNRAVPADDEPLVWPSPRLGRGYVASGAAVALLAFVALPLARVDGDQQMGGAMLALALHGTHKLWLIPAAAWAQLAILYRRRTPAAMRAARLAVALVACVLPLSALWTYAAVRDAVSLLAQRTGQDLYLHVASGAYALALAFVAMLAGSLRLGSAPRS
jgi:hypothetical protein